MASQVNQPAQLQKDLSVYVCTLSLLCLYELMGQSCTVPKQLQNSIINIRMEPCNFMTMGCSWLCGCFHIGSFLTDPTTSAGLKHKTEATAQAFHEPSKTPSQLLFTAPLFDWLNPKWDSAINLHPCRMAIYAGRKHHMRLVFSFFNLRQRHLCLFMHWDELHTPRGSPITKGLSPQCHG